MGITRQIKRELQFKTWSKYCLALLLGGFAVTAYSQIRNVGDQFTTVDGIKYEVTSPVELKVIDYIGSATDVMILTNFKNQHVLQGNHYWQ